MVAVTNRKLEELSREVEDLKEKINRVDRECAKN